MSIMGQDVKQVDTYKYLGVHFNNRPDWKVNTEAGLLFWAVNSNNLLVKQTAPLVKDFFSFALERSHTAGCLYHRNHTVQWLIIVWRASLRITHRAIV